MQQVDQARTSPEAATMKGAVLGLILHDVCEEIRLEELRQILGAKRVEPSFKHATPEYVRFEKPPVVEQLEPVVLSNGETLKLQIKYYDYGVISVLLEREFVGTWASWCSWPRVGFRILNWRSRRSRLFAGVWKRLLLRSCALTPNG